YLKTSNGPNTGWVGIATVDMVNSADLNWTYALASNSMRTATATTDIILGSTATSTGAGAYFDLAGGTSGTSTFYFGYATNSNVIIGGTSNTTAFMNAAYSINGNDLFVGGNIGSASSIYTNGELVVGPGSTHYGDGSINKNNGNLNISSSGNTSIAAGGINLNAISQVTISAAGGDIQLGNSSEYISVGGTFASSLIPLGSTYTLGSSAATWNAYLGSVSAAGRVDAPYLNRWYLSPLLRDTIKGGTMATTTVGSNPYGVAFDGAYIWVTNLSSANVSKINVTTNQVVATVAVGTNPAGLAFDGRYMWVANQGTSNVSQIDVTTNQVVATTTVGTTPTGVAFDGSYIWVTNYGSATVSKISTTSSAVVATVNTGSFPKSIAFDGQRMWIGEVALTRLASIDVQTNTWTVGPTLIYAPEGLVFDGTHLWVVLGSTGGYVTKVNVNTNSNITNVPIPSGSGTLDAAFDGDGVWVSYSGGVAKIDVKTNAVSMTKTAGTTPRGIAFDGNHIWVANYGSANVTKLPIGGASDSTQNMGMSLVPVSGNTINLGAVSYAWNTIYGNTVTGTTINGNTGVFGTISAGRFTGYVSSTAISGTYQDFTYSSSSVLSTGSVSTTNLIVSGYATVTKLMVSNSATATGTANWQAVIRYTGSATGGLCIDDSTSTQSCPTVPGTGASIFADGNITANAFDLAERYLVTGPNELGDVLVLDSATSATVKISTGIPYDQHLIGVVSTAPGLRLGWLEDTSAVDVALSGRVPTHVNMENGTILVGDPLTSSHVPGVAMKATRPGMIIGYALSDAFATGTIEVFMNIGYNANTTLNTDGSLSILGDDLVVGPIVTPDSMQSWSDSWGLTFRGNAWDASSTNSANRDFTLLTNVISSTSSAFVIRNATSSDLFAVDSAGSVRVMGDFGIMGKLYPSEHDKAQSAYYIYVDDTSTTHQYISTNADGWQSESSYDLAERYYSATQLKSGDLVMSSNEGDFGVQKAIAGSPIMGVVSTKPGFVLGVSATDTYPIALTGRVPTRVSGANGAIHIGDLVGTSDVAGVASKMTKNGYVVGIALEEYANPDTGLIQVFLSPNWNGSFTAAQEVVAAPSVSTPVVKQGFADIAAGTKSVEVHFASISAYPSVMLTPYAQVDGIWWVEQITDTGFRVVMMQEQTHDVRFAWRVTPSQAGDMLINSDGTFGPIDPTTGIGPAMGSGATASSTDPGLGSSTGTDPVPAPTPDPIPVPDPIPDPVPAPTPDPVIDLGGG
ncbi:MAG: YncE family protein, partial [Candidatus Uhrbacteria bacterium]